MLKVLVQKCRNIKAAKRFIRKLLSGRSGAPRVMVGVAKRDIGLRICHHRQYKGLNNRAENSHQPIRRCEPVIKHFRSRDMFKTSR